MSDYAEKEIMNIVDELASAAASLSQGPQNYDMFIKARESCQHKIHVLIDKQRQSAELIRELTNLL